MVTNDYGKRAYAKLSSLEKRIEKLENFAIESVYSEIFYNLAGSEISKEFTKKFKINALKDGVYNFTSNLETDLASLLTVKLEVFVNGVCAYILKNVLLSKYTFSFDVPLNKGENEITVKVYSSSIFNIKVLNFKICGNVAYVKSVNALSHIQYNGVDYFLHYKDGDCFVYTYRSEILQNVGVYNGVKECSIVKVDDSYLYILAVNTSGVLIFLTFNLIEKDFAVYDLGVSGVDSACGFYNNNKFVICFSKLSNLFKGEYSINSKFNYENLGIKGVKVYTDPLANGNMIVVDKYLNARLYTD